MRIISGAARISSIKAVEPVNGEADMNLGQRMFDVVRLVRLTSLRLKVVSIATLLMVLGLAVGPAQLAGATPSGNTYYVNSATDTGAGDCSVATNTDCGIDDAIAAFNADTNAGDADTIVFSSAIATFIVGTPTAIDNTTSGVNLVINGNGPSNTAVSGNNASSVFVVDAGVTATISGLTIENGYATQSPSNVGGATGGGILNEGTLTVTDSTVSNNSAVYGGGISNVCNPSITNCPSAILTVTDSTISDNSASAHSGGILNGGQTTVTDSTISDNSASYGGGIGSFGTTTVTHSTLAGNSGDGIYNGSGSATLVATIVANSSGGDCSSPITDGGYNLDTDGTCGFSGANDSFSDTPADLAGLQNNGGPTSTIALETDSPAIDAVTNPADCTGKDQQGVPWPDPCDIGATSAVTVAPDTITFNSEGGSAVSSISGPGGTTINLPAAPTDPGYTFTGWFAASSGGTALTSPYTLTGSAILYAQWTANAPSTYSPVDFSSQANFTWLAQETDPDGATATYFPGGPVGSVTLGGIPFNIATNAAGFQAWNGWTASGGENGTVSITMPVNDYGATDVYTLINTYWGTPSGPYTTLVFTGSGGATYTDQLFLDSDIRGWCCVGSINGTSTTNVYSEASSPINGAQGFLDMQHIVLPPVFATQTLTSIQVVDSGVAGIQRTILDGVTVATAASVATEDTVAFNSEGGSAVASVSGLDGSSITLPSDTYPGYAFDGWFDAPGGTLVGFAGDSYTIPSGGATLYAQWSAQCTAGSFSASGTAPCTPAPAGSFVGTTGGTSATACPAGTFSATSGASSCTPAPAGSYDSGTGNRAATACPAGTFSTTSGASSCTPAPAGSFVGTTGGTVATTCPAGTFSATSGASSCTPAPAGSYDSGTGNRAATACPAGTFSATSGASSCTPAPAGSYDSGTGNRAATACPAGTFSTTIGASSCTPAPAGSYDSGTGNTAPMLCPAGLTSSSGATSCAAGNCEIALPTTGATTIITGTYSGNIEVKNGTSLWLDGGTITGNVTIDATGKFAASGGSVKGNVTSSGGPVSLQGTIVSGNVQTQNAGLALGANTKVSGNVQVTGGTTLCISGNGNGAVTIMGNLQVEQLGAATVPAIICNTKVSGNLTYEDNADPALIGGSGGCTGDTVSGNIQVEDNTAQLTIGGAGTGYGNTAAGNIQVEHNTGGGTLTDNTSTGGNCQLGSDTPGITGTLNAVKSGAQNTCNPAKPD
jgi:uncharacterized repeat protein (TIGR02543 family)